MVMAALEAAIQKQRIWRWMAGGVIASEGIGVINSWNAAYGVSGIFQDQARHALTPRINAGALSGATS
jgi:hypothetical protein